MRLSEAVKKAVKSKKITQAELGSRIGVTQGGIAMYLRRELNIQVESLLKMVNACGYDLVLVDRDDTKNAFVIGNNDEIGELKDADFDERVRKLIDAELDKRIGESGK